MLDHASFHALLSDRLGGLDRRERIAVELHLHGGESFFLCCVRQLRPAYALCEIVPMDEDIGDGSRWIPVREAAVPYTTIADLVVSGRRFRHGHPAGFRGVAESGGVDGPGRASVAS
ncbi:MAG: hypothetical protein ACODAE_05375 [Gemmatimonadota bacterium]